jgi:hypothetical protein
MEVTKAQAKNLLTSRQTFTQLGFNLLITRLSGIYGKNPSDQTLEQCTNEMNMFLQKYSAIMKNDFEAIIG